MEQKQLEALKEWFNGYVRTFYGEDEYTNVNLKRKAEHTQRICEEMRYLTGQLGLNEEQSRLAEAIALLHDVGRFPQFVKHQTYNDAKSINHCLLGLEQLGKADALADIDLREREIIEKSIQYHGEKDLPADLDGECLLYAKLIRDADKLDIYYSIAKFYLKYLTDPEKYNMEMEVPDTPEYTKEVVAQILRGEKIDYRGLATWNDMKMLQLGWVYDVNFEPTLRRIREKGYLEAILECLPENSDMEMVRQKILGYIEERIGKA